MNTVWWNTPLWAGIQLTPRAMIVAGAILLAGWLLSMIVRRALWQTGPGQAIEASTRYSLSRLIHYAIIVLSGLLTLNALGVGVGSLAVVAGAFGIGIGFGLQSIASNFVSGLILLFERPIRIGDRVSLGTLDQDAVGQVNGYVRAIKLRATVIETPDRISLIVPNSQFVTSPVVNWSLGDPRMRIRLRIGVAYDSDLDRVRAVLVAAAAEHPVTLDDPKPEVRMVETADSALVFELLVWIPDPRHRGQVESDLREQIVRQFRDLGIAIPFPQRQVRLTQAATPT